MVGAGRGQPVSPSRLFGLQSETVPSEGSSHSKNTALSPLREASPASDLTTTRWEQTSTSILLVPKSTGIGSQIILKHFVCFANYIITLTSSSTLFSRSRWPLNCIVWPRLRSCAVTFAGGLNLDWLIVIWMEFTCAALRSQSSWLFFKQSAGWPDRTADDLSFCPQTVWRVYGLEQNRIESILDGFFQKAPLSSLSIFLKL